MNFTAATAAETTLLIRTAHQRPITTTALLLLACLFAFKTAHALKGGRSVKIPVVGIEYGGQENRRKRFMNGEAWNMYLDGYKKFKEQAYQITTAIKSKNIVVNPKYMNELQKLPDDVLSVSKAVEEAMHAKYTGILTDGSVLEYTIKTALTPSLARINPVIFAEVSSAVRSQFPQSGGAWSEVNIMEKVMRTVAIVSGRIFIGPELCHDEAYLNVSINYTIDLMAAIQAVAAIPPYLRPFLAARRPEVKKVQHRIAEADEFLKPVIEARRKRATENPDYQKPDDMLQWMMDLQHKYGQKKDKELARYQLAVSAAAIHTTTAMITNALYTLAAIPEFVSVLREDVQEALAKSNGVFTSSAMQNMKKMDSFLKECLRCYCTQPTAFQRKVLKDFSLSNGQVIPAGAFIEVPSVGVYKDEEFFLDADKFDPLRFYKLRENKREEKTGSKQAEVVANSQFVSVSQSSLEFGYGRHACPGRFFAVNEIKMIMATLLATYDLKNVGGSKGRYPNIVTGPTRFPDPTRKILLKKI
ncbi:cytochrome P450 [Colletotrichum zoysiae]|uniref:Cytochrome P450 n=1 Tax=Colletotrichum zoysiae TaxID=1216348 RepID=A0AAD9HAH3_9PEZI|nr:cytochrome P450 [Colletotrichum zoysiae]